MKPLLRPLALLLLLAAAAPAEDDAPWSAPSGGVQARLHVLQPDPGTPFFRVDIEFRNTAEGFATRKIDFSPDHLTCSLEDRDHHAVPLSLTVYDGFAPIWTPIILQREGATYRQRIDLRGAGVPLGTWRVIDLGIPNVWILPRPGAYFLSGTFSIPPSPQHLPRNPREDWRGTLILPPVPLPAAP